MNNKINHWITHHSLDLLRISIGIVYVWFGALKFFPKLSPADQLAKDTIDLITFGLFSSNASILLLAIWETILGILLIIGLWNRSIFFMLLLHMVCTFAPLFFFTELSFTTSPYAFTLVGQYIMKNIIIICAAIVINVHAQGKISFKSTT
jgi:uncharacterized membrane protein YkgB